MLRRYLAQLKLARVRRNQKIAGLEAKLAFQRGRLKTIGAAIQKLEPELTLLPPPARRANPVLKRGEVSRLTLKVMREAGEPLASPPPVAGAIAVGNPEPSVGLTMRMHDRDGAMQAKQRLLNRDGPRNPPGDEALV